MQYKPDPTLTAKQKNFSPLSIIYDGHGRGGSERGQSKLIKMILPISELIAHLVDTCIRCNNHRFISYYYTSVPYHLRNKMRTKS